MELAKPDLFNHRKFKALCARLKGMHKLYVRAHLDMMWEVGYHSGNPLLGTAEDVELAAEWDITGRETGEWFDAMLNLGWIDDLGNGLYQIHDLLDHAPEYVKKRAKRVAERENKDLHKNTADIVRRCPPNGSTPAPAPAPAPAPESNTSSGASPPLSGKKKRKPKPTNPNHKPAVEYFCEAWNRKYGRKYPFNGGKDGEHFSWMLSQVGNELDVLRRIIDSYFDDSDERQLAAKAGHSAGVLKSQFPRYVAKGGSKNATQRDLERYKVLT